MRAAVLAEVKEGQPVLHLVVVGAGRVPAAACAFQIDDARGMLDARGRVDLMPVSGRLRVSCGALGFVDTRLVSQSGELELMLEAPTELHVHVADSEGVAVAAELSALNLDWGESATATTDVEGRATFVLPAGNIHLEVKRPEQTLRRELQTFGGVEPVEFQVGTRVVSGVARRPDGGPVMGATVELVDTVGQRTVGPLTDAQGHFRVEHLSATSLDVMVELAAEHLSGRAAARPRASESGETYDSEVTVVLRIQPEITGTVLTAAGAPLEAVQVNAQKLASPAGRFRFGTLAEGQPLELSISAEGYVPRLVVAPSPRSDVGEVRLEQGRALRGLVVDSRTSAPVPGATLTRSSSGKWISKTTADNLGAFTLTGLGETVELTITAPGFVSRKGAWPTTSDLRLELFHGVGVQVRPAIDGELSSFTVTYSGPGGLSTRTAHKNKGPVRIDSLEPGTWRLQGSGIVCRQGNCAGARFEPTTAHVRGDEARDVEVVMRERTPGQKVFLYDPAKRSNPDLPSGVYVLIAGNHPTPTRRSELLALLENAVWYAQGGSVEDVPPGDYTLLVLSNRDDWPAVATQPLTVTQSSSSFALEPPRWTTLTGD